MGITGQVRRKLSTEMEYMVTQKVNALTGSTAIMPLDRSLLRGAAFLL